MTEMVFLATSFYYKTALVAYCFAMKPHWWPDFLLLSKWPQWPVFASEKSMTYDLSYKVTECHTLMVTTTIQALIQSSKVSVILK